MSKLPENYKFALQALKQQALGASNTFLHLGKQVNHKGKSELKNAQLQMSKYDSECRHIVRLLTAKNSTLPPIPDLSEEELMHALIANATQGSGKQSQNSYAPINK